MKKLFITIAVVIAGITASNAQELTEVTTFEGVVIGTSDRTAAHELTHVIQQSSGPVKYIVKENTTGLEFETLPYAAQLAPGTLIAFSIINMENGQPQTSNVLTNTQKSKHDAAMAAIQNTR